MDIVFVINSLVGGGAERVVQVLSRYLLDRGHGVTVIMLEGGKQRYNLDERVKVIKLKTSFLIKGFGKVVFLKLQAFELSRLLKKLRPDATLSFLVRANLTHLMTRYFGNKNPILLSEHNMLTQKYSGRASGSVMNFLMKWQYPKATKIIAVSDEIKESLEKEYGVQNTTIERIYNPQEIFEIMGRCHEKVKIELDKSCFKIINVGSLTPQKDHVMLLNAFAELRKRNLNVGLAILGLGPEEERLKKQAKQLKINDRIWFAGWQKNPFGIMSKCDVFAMSSKFEGFPMVLVEALACGLPIVSTDCPSGPNELLQGGKYGLLTPVGDPIALADGIEKLMKDKKLLGGYKKNAIGRVEEFDVSIIGKKYIELFEESVIE